jgi:hypothetical protein
VHTVAGCTIARWISMEVVMFSPLSRALAVLAPAGAPPSARKPRQPPFPVPPAGDDASAAEARLRYALATTAEDLTTEDHYLRLAVRDFVVAQRARGALVERVIIALKDHVREMVAVPRGHPYRDTIIGRVVPWCIDDYYHFRPSAPGAPARG